MEYALKTTGRWKLGVTLAFLVALIRASSLPVKVIYQFPEDLGKSWLECVLVRDNGDLLLTTLKPSASIYTLSHLWSAHPQITSNITIPHLDGALSLVELSQNKYAVGAAKFNDIYLKDGTSELWLVDLSNAKKPTYRHLASIPEAGELNDMVVLKGSDTATDILVADATHYRIWKVSIETGAHSVWLDSPEMHVQINNSTERWPFGINGLRYGTDGYLYFTNTNTRIIWRIKPRADGTATPDDVEYVHEVCAAAALDSLAIDQYNRLWVASNKDNKLILVERHGSTWKSEVVLGGDTKRIVAGDTAVTFGKTEKDALMLYVVTSGANASPIPPHNFTEPAKVVRVNVSGRL